MQKIDKSTANILSSKYWEWYQKQVAENKYAGKGSDHYYDDIVMNLYHCQRGVCAYTEMPLCVPAYFDEGNWKNGRYHIPSEFEDKRPEHFGELEHFDPDDKKTRYWNWDNLFMIHASINSAKSNKESVPFLKPDLEDYSPDKYLDYDPDTNRFVPNSDYENSPVYQQIKHMIDHVLYINHSSVEYERKNYLNEIRYKRARGEQPEIDRFFTAVRMAIE